MVLEVLRPEAVLDQLTIAFLVANHDRPRVHFNNLPFDPEVFDKHAIATP